SATNNPTCPGPFGNTRAKTIFCVGVEAAAARNPTETSATRERSGVAGIRCSLSLLPCSLNLVPCSLNLVPCSLLLADLVVFLADVVDQRPPRTPGQRPRGRPLLAIGLRIVDGDFGRDRVRRGSPVSFGHVEGIAMLVALGVELRLVVEANRVDDERVV